MAWIIYNPSTITFTDLIEKVFCVFQDEDVAVAELAEFKEEMARLRQFDRIEIYEGDVVVDDEYVDSKLGTWLCEGGVYYPENFDNLQLMEIKSR
jgi:hypothetical protein